LLRSDERAQAARQQQQPQQQASAGADGAGAGEGGGVEGQEPVAAVPVAVEAAVKDDAEIDIDDL
jgi:hypothetical protein